MCVCVWVAIHFGPQLSQAWIPGLRLFKSGKSNIALGAQTVTLSLWRFPGLNPQNSQADPDHASGTKAQFPMHGYLKASRPFHICAFMLPMLAPMSAVIFERLPKCLWFQCCCTCPPNPSGSSMHACKGAHQSVTYYMYHIQGLLEGP